MKSSLLWKVAIGLASVVLLVAVGIPLGLYGLGLSNIEGRPIPPARTDNLIADVALLQQDFRNQSPIVIHVLNPWIYLSEMRPATPPDATNGPHAVWIVARNYNSRHLRNQRMSGWHLSGAALTIWLTRHWTSAEIVAAAAAIVRSAFPAYDSSSLVEMRSLRSLPSELSTLLGSNWKCCGMVDSGEEFHPTDVVGNPTRRFLLAGVSKDSALVAYEWGNGWERGIDAATYVLRRAEWHLIARWHLDFNPESLSQLREATDKLPRETVQIHYFDAEPFLGESGK